MKKVVFVCISCGDRQQIEVLSPEEAAEFRRQGRRVGGGLPMCRQCSKPMIEES